MKIIVFAALIVVIKLIQCTINFMPRVTAPFILQNRNPHVSHSSLKQPREDSAVIYWVVEMFFWLFPPHTQACDYFSVSAETIFRLKRCQVIPINQAAPPSRTHTHKLQPQSDGGSDYKDAIGLWARRGKIHEERWLGKNGWQNGRYSTVERVCVSVCV